jgi:tetratricopeptide (TPR) repeat protein
VRGSKKGTEPHPSTPSSLRSEFTQDASTFDDDLHDLLARGLLHRDEKNRYDLHPIVRRYAYDRLTVSDRTAAHNQLRDYFAAVPTPSKVQTLDDLQPVIELYHHTVRAGQYDEAMDLFYSRINKAAYYQLGAYQLQIELLRALFPDGEDRPPRLKNESAQAWTLNELANSYGLSCQPRRAAPLFERVNDIYENQMKNKQYLATGLGNVAYMAQLPIGALRAAEANLRRRIDLCREIEDEWSEDNGHRELGHVLAYRGIWDAAKEEFAAALTLAEKINHVQDQGLVWAYRALRALLMARILPSPVERGLLDGRGAGGEDLSAARRALELADEDARTSYPVESDYVRAHWLLGAAYRLNGDLTQAEQHLSEALTRCRNINNVEHEADVLLDLAHLRVDQGEREEALRLVQEALLIAERSGYVLQGADVQLFLAQEALKDNDKAQALQHASKARELATCDGPPDYTYKVAYDEAGALLKKLG